MSGGAPGFHTDGLHLRFFLGVCSALLTITLSSTGFVMQRWAHLHDSEQRSTRKLWAAGVALYLSAAPFDVVAYTLAPHAVCTAIGCLRLVLYMLLANAFLGEILRVQEWLGMLTCSLGTFLCLHFGPKELGDKHVSESMEEGGALAAYLATGLSILGVLLALEYCDTKGPGPGARCSYFTLPVATALAFALEKVFNTEIGLQVDGLSLQESLGLASVWWMGAMIVALGLLEFCLNLRGAKVLPVASFVPMTFAVGTVMQYFQAMCILGEFAHVPQPQASLSLLGTIMSLVGGVAIRPPALAPSCRCASACGGGEAGSDTDGESDSDGEEDKLKAAAAVPPKADGGDAQSEPETVAPLKLATEA